MFTGTVESRSHEGGLLVHFEGSSPALNAIMVRAEDGVYVGKVDGVLGSTDHPLAHVAHIDRSLDMDDLIGIQLKIRAKVQREQRKERNHGREDRSHRGTERDRRGGRDHRSGGRFDNRRSNDRGRQFNNDWTCPQCNNSNFAFRDACNRCQAPRPSGANQGRSNRRYDDDRRSNRGHRAEGRYNNDRGVEDSVQKGGSTTTDVEDSVQRTMTDVEDSVQQ